ncbi:MAG: hypothetical protein AAGN82_06955 [Myxococcota bacterium]
MKCVLIVSRRERRVTAIRRTEEGFRERDYRPGESLPLGEGHGSFAVDEVYAGIDLE